MTTRKDKTEEQAERDERVRALRAKFEYYLKRGRVTRVSVSVKAKLQSSTISNIMNGEAQFDQRAARTNLLKIIKGLALNNALLSVDEANDFLQAGGFEPLHDDNINDREVIHLLEESERNHNNNHWQQVIPFTAPSNEMLLGTYVTMLTKQLPVVSKDSPGKDLSSLFERVMIESLITAIYDLLTTEVQEVFRRLGIFEYSCHLDNAIDVCRSKTLDEDNNTLREDCIQSLEMLRRYELIRVADQQVQFSHPIIQGFALKRLKEASEYEQIKWRYIHTYLMQFECLIFLRYGFQASPNSLENSPQFLRLTQDEVHFYTSMQAIKEERERHIEKAIQQGYIGQNKYEETLWLLELSPEVLTDKEKDWIEEFEQIYQTVVGMHDCPYPIVEWFWKYLAYELNPDYFYTSNTFAEWHGYSYVKYVWGKRDQYKYKWSTL